MRSPRLSFAAVCLSWLALGCGASYGDGSGVDEPLVVASATFTNGKLPDDGGEAIPLTTSLSSQAYAGGPERTLSGRASLDAYAVALRLKEVGTGYWVVPVGLPDLIDPGLDWSAKLRFTRAAPLGKLTLQVAQTDARGHFSKPSEVPFTIKSLRPDGKKVISLVWHNHADLDLQVMGPSGALTSAKHPHTGGVADAGSGVLDRDSGARCAFDGLMQEDVVFTADPTPGDYLVWVDQFDACGEPATTYDLQLWEDGVETFHVVGQQLEINADNGTGPGLFMHTFSF